jgi:rubrerythrin
MKMGHPQAARLFRAAAEAEAVHAANHLRALKAIKSTKENLREAITGETHEFKEMYPEMIAAAKAEGVKDAEKSFNYANAVEEYHAKLYHEMLEGLDAKNDSYPYFVCPVCGMTVEREAPEKCPVCGVLGSMFKKIE